MKYHFAIKSYLHIKAKDVKYVKEVKWSDSL